jgi:acyl carrier protein
MTVQAQVRAFILDSYYVSDPAELTDELSLIDSGVVDSTGMLEIILFIEGQYGLHVEDWETTPENLETIGRIADFVARKQAAAA